MDLDPAVPEFPQVNLLPNPSFENGNHAPQGYRFSGPAGCARESWAREGAPLPARMWVMADDGEHLFPRYCYRFSIPRVGFHAAPEDSWLDVPSDRVTVGASRGFEYAPAQETVRVAPGETREITLVPRRTTDMRAGGWRAPACPGSLRLCVRSRRAAR